MLKEMIERPDNVSLSFPSSLPTLFGFFDYFHGGNSEHLNCARSFLFCLFSNLVSKEQCLLK